MDRLIPPIRCAPGTDLELLIAYTCPYGLRIGISGSFFRTAGKETVENLKITPGQLLLCQEKRIKRQKTVSSGGCKVLQSNAGFPLASMPSPCRFRTIECSYSRSVSVSVPQDKVRGSAIEWTPGTDHRRPTVNLDYWKGSPLPKNSVAYIARFSRAR